MTSAEIRQSFLDFFARHGHTIVPSSSLMPDSPGLLFTNAGMNQFVPIFLGDRAPDVSKWAGVRPGRDTRAADTQKCIRAGGKHNDLEDVGFDTYHHTMFEMLGNWSFGDYFKRESIEWGWELITGEPKDGCWGIPPKRLFATIFCPYMGMANWEKNWVQELDYFVTQSEAGISLPVSDTGQVFNRSDFEAGQTWALLFKRAGLDPAKHIVPGNKKDNFWMMGDTGPCGPCSEIHFNLLPDEPDDRDGKRLEAKGRLLVNASSPRCIEIWNHVFIQFNANADGTFSPLAARHVDTGMGFERVAGIYATTKGFKDFTKDPSNYAADVFAPLFRKVAELSQKEYKATVPAKREGLSEQENIDVAFRVLADHARCVSCAIADGILPGNEDRNYVIKKILRRGLLYGRKLDLPEGFFEKLVDPVVESLGNVFPELVERRDVIKKVIRSEECQFSEKLKDGLELFAKATSVLVKVSMLREPALSEVESFVTKLNTKNYRTNDEILEAGWSHFMALKQLHAEFRRVETLKMFGRTWDLFTQSVDSFQGSLRAPTIAEVRSRNPMSVRIAELLSRMVEVREQLTKFENYARLVPGRVAFTLYDTYGFPPEVTQLVAAEAGLTVDVAGFEELMEKQRDRARAARKKDVIVAATEGDASVAYEASLFTGYVIDTEKPVEAIVSDVVRSGDDMFLVFDRTPFYAEMGGQAGDTGTAVVAGETIAIIDTVKDKAGRHLHKIDRALIAKVGARDLKNSAAELMIDYGRRRAISRHHSAAHLIHWALRKTLGTHVRQAGTSKTPERMRFDFSHFEAMTPDQLHEVERLVNERVIDNARVETYETEFDKKPEGTLAFFGDKYGKIVRVVDIGGYSRELCGGTHVATTGEIGLIKIVAEMAIAAGTRRIEAVAGQAAYEFMTQREAALAAVNARLNAGPLDVVQKLETVLAHQKELEKKLRSYEQKASAGQADDLAAKAVARDGLKFVTAVVSVDTPESLRSLGSQVLAKIGDGVVQLGASFGDKATVVAFCSPAAVKAGFQAGKLVNEISQKLGGKGGGKPDFAMGGGKDVAKLNEVLKP